MARRGLVLVAAGLGIGLLGAFAFTQLAGTLLFGVTAADALSFFGAAAGLALVCATALYGPARCASRLDPQNALRQ